MTQFNVYRWRKSRGAPAHAVKVASVEADHAARACVAARHLGIAGIDASSPRLFASPADADPYAQGQTP